MVIHVKKERKMPKVFIIVEAGVNHNGSVKIAKKMIDAAVNAGADAIKFQTFHAQSLVSKFAPKAIYQIKATRKGESQQDMLERLELDLAAHRELMQYCRKKKIMFLSSPFDLGSIDFLKRLGLRVFKIPSGEITNLPYLRKIGSLRRKIIMSTGMANLKEIEDALGILVKNGTKKEDITLLHCNTEYPTSFNDANLLAMCTIRDKFGVKVGYSDHTLGIEASIAAVALGANIIEKHFTLDRNMRGPDHQASLEPNELMMMVKAIRNIEKAMGNGKKRPSKTEMKNINVVRKSIVALMPINKGEIFTENNITTKRPGSGINPMKWDEVVGKRSKRNFKEEEFIKIV